MGLLLLLIQALDGSSGWNGRKVFEGRWSGPMGNNVVGDWKRSLIGLLRDPHFVLDFVSAFCR